MAMAETYEAWPEMCPELMSRVAAQLSRSLSSAVSGSPYLVAEPYVPLDLATAARARDKRRPPHNGRGADGDDDDGEQLRFADVTAFFLSLRPSDTTNPAMTPSHAGEGEGTAVSYARSLGVPEKFFCHTELFDVASLLRGNDVFDPFLLARLSFYLDGVEVELMRLTARKSDAFFAALVEIKELYIVVQKSTTLIRASRAALARVDECGVRGVTRVAQLRRRVQNEQRCSEELRRISHVLKEANGIDCLIAEGRFGEAIEMAESAQCLLKRMVGIASLRDLATLLRSKVQHVKRDMQRQLCDMVAEPFNQTRIERIGLPLLQGLAKGRCLDVAWLEMQDCLVGFIARELETALTTRAANFKPSAYESGGSSLSRPPPPSRSPVLRFPEVSNPLYEVSGDCESAGSWPQDNVIPFVESLRYNEQVALLELLMAICLREVEKICHLGRLLRIIIIDEKDSASLDMAVQESLSAVCEFVHSRIAALLELKSAENAMLSLNQFGHIFGLCQNFGSECEAMAGKKSSHALRGCIMSQAKGFLSTFQHNQSKMISVALENEKWGGTKVPREYQLLIDTLCEQKESVFTALDLWEEKYMYVEKSRFAVVSCALVLVRGISEYLTCLNKLPVLAVDITLLLRGYLASFNSKCANLILGAQAIHGSAKLKSISIKNMALCYESIRMAEALVGPVLSKVAPHLSERQQVLLEDYKSLQQDCAQHRQKLLGMLVVVMRNTVLSYMGKLRPSEWAAFPDRVSDYVNGISDKFRATELLLSSLLCVSDRERVMDAALAAANEVVWDTVSALELPTKGARRRLKADVALLCENLRSFDGINSSLGAVLTEKAAKLFAE